MSLTDEELAAIGQRVLDVEESNTECNDPADYIAVLEDSQGDVKPLLAEVRELRATLDRVRELADEAPMVPVHAGGGNLVDRRRMVRVSALRAALEGADDE